MKKHLRTVLALLILSVTIAAFIYYIKKHPETLDQLRQLPPAVIVVLLLVYGISFLSYVLVTRGSLWVYRKTMSMQENILFNAYSSLINFFGPGQSGPIFRAAYLKKRHNLRVKQFMFTLMVYFGFYAIISAVFVVVGSRPWWQTALLMLVVGAASLYMIKRYKKRSRIDTEGGLNPKTVGWIFGATALQVASFAVIYGIELQRVGAEASIGQILSYSGISNFSLFVALTPGAIGIREAFLVFSQSLHQIDTSTIVAANIIDRAVYLLFLGLLALVVVGLHARDKLGIRQLDTNQK